MASEDYLFLEHDGKRKKAGRHSRVRLPGAHGGPARTLLRPVSWPRLPDGNGQFRVTVIPLTSGTPSCPGALPRLLRPLHKVKLLQGIGAIPEEHNRSLWTSQELHTAQSLPRSHAGAQAALRFWKAMTLRCVQNTSMLIGLFRKAGTANISLALSRD